MKKLAAIVMMLLLASCAAKTDWVEEICDGYNPAHCRPVD